MFKDTLINITFEGKRYLGAAIETIAYRKSFVGKKVGDWVQQLEFLTKIAKQYPHAAYSAYVCGFKHKLNYVIRTIPSIEEDLKPIEHVIRTKLILALCDGRSCNNDESDLLSLPVKFGGMGLDDITQIAVFEFESSKSVTTKLLKEIKDQNISDSVCAEQQIPINTTARKQRHHQQLLFSLRGRMTTSQIKANGIAQSDGACHHCLS